MTEREQKILNAISPIYKRLYGESTCEYMARYIDLHIEVWAKDVYFESLEESIKTYIWMNTSGGGTAEIAAQKVMEAINAAP